MSDKIKHSFKDELYFTYPRNIHLRTACIATLVDENLGSRKREPIKVRVQTGDGFVKISKDDEDE